MSEEAFQGYFAAFLDGEGTISVHNNRPVVSLANTNLEVLSWIQDMVEVPATMQAVKPKNPHHRVCYRLNWRGESALWVLKLAYPYLRVKQAQAKEILEKWVVKQVGYRCTPEELAIRADVKKSLKDLNTRGAILSARVIPTLTA